MLILEAAIDNINDATLAVKNGANRLEVCSDLLNNGLTPSTTLFQECKQLNIPCFVMIRPQAGDFLVNKTTFQTMKQQILQFKALHASGIVLGILNQYKQIDLVRVAELVKLANPLPVTFHKAIDCTPNIIEAVVSLIDTGVKRILASGGKKTVLEGVNNIKSIYNHVNSKITIVAGGAVKFNNLAEVQKLLPFC